MKQVENIGQARGMAIAAGQSFEERAYWLNILAGELPDSNFPFDFKKKITEGPVIHSIKNSITGELFAQMLKLSNNSDSRLQMILTAGVVVLLYKYTGHRDIIVGIPVDRQEMAGDFINTVLPIRNYLEEKISFKTLLLQVRKTIVEAAEHQNYPIEALLYDLGMNPAAGYFPLFSTGVVLENIQDKEYLRHVPLGMNFVFFKEEDGIDAVIEYDSLLYEKNTVERVFHHLKIILSEAVPNVDRLLSDLEILRDEERQQLLVDFNGNGMECAGAGIQTIHGLFREQVEKTPNAFALVYENEAKGLTYSQLNEKTNRLARALQMAGVGPGSIVGICMERSLELVIGMLGILKAGGAYLPIDLEYPADRIAYMLQDSAVQVFLIKGKWLENIPFNGKILYLDKPGIYHSDGSDLPGDSTESSQCAYIIYTSGSTGRPKGVVVEHKSIVNTLYWRKNYYGFNISDAILQIPSFSFDSSVEDIFTPLISGSKLVLIDHQQQFELDYLRNIIEQNRVTHFLIIPNFYKSFLENNPDAIKNLEFITVAGDNFTEELVREHWQKVGRVKLYNEYGPTENSVCSTVYQFSPGERRVLIGKPISNVKCLILDEMDELVPIGVPGELHLAGAGLARGYLNQVELTANKFVENKSITTGKIYKSGDLARWMIDGNIEFLGRKDHQVKIRGFRIELGEIENVMLKYPQVQEAIVMAREDKHGDKYLCAYLVAASGLNIMELKNYQLAHLPDYMLPAQFVLLDELPLSPNGKIDRGKLPEPEGYLNTGFEYQAPQTDLEKSLAGIWQKELGLEKIGIHDNYFNIGGDSIKSIRLINRINEELNKNLKVIDLYANNTIEKLAQKIRHEQQCDDDGASQVSQEYGRVLSKLDELQKRIMGE